MKKRMTYAQAETSKKRSADAMERLQDDVDGANEVDSMSVEEWADWRGVEITENPQKERPSMKQAELLAQIEELEAANAELEEANAALEEQNAELSAENEELEEAMSEIFGQAGKFFDDDGDDGDEETDEETDDDGEFEEETDDDDGDGGEE